MGILHPKLACRDRPLAWKDPGPASRERWALPLLLACLLSAPALQARTLTGTVTRVWDGDTVTLTVDDTEHRVRLSGIDAPEHDQPYGDAARDHLQELLLNREVLLEGGKKDKYGRLLGKIRVQPPDCRRCGRTLDANLEMLTVGLAWWYRYYAREQSAEDRSRYEFAEREARARRAGLWQQDNPTPPWDWPRGERTRATPPDGCRIKGNISQNGRIYHLPGQKYYSRTKITPSKGERWFCSEAEAREAGWRRAEL